MKYSRFFILIYFTSALFIYGSGFQINEHGSKAMGMGGAFTALANDPSAIYFNPGGITQLIGTNIIAGTTIILPKTTFRGPSPYITEYKLKDQIFTPLHIYGTHQVNEKLFLGFGLGNNFGLGTKWDKDWIGKYLAVETEIRTFFFNLVASYKVSNELSVGFGYILSYGDVTIGRSLNLSPFITNTYLELNGRGLGSGFTAGLQYKPYRSLWLGLSYRSQVTFEFEGDAEPSNYPAELSEQIPNGSITAPLTTPENITFGIAIRPLKNFIITADYQYIGWDSYDKLQINFDDFYDADTGERMISTAERFYENSFTVRLGTEYILDKKTSVFAGYLYDKNPIKDEYLDPTLPDSDRIGLSFGFEYKLARNLAIQTGYLFLRFEEREITNSNENYSGIPNAESPLNGVYNSSAHLISLTFNYSL